MLFLGEIYRAFLYYPEYSTVILFVSRRRRSLSRTLNDQYDSITMSYREDLLLTLVSFCDPSAHYPISF